MLDEWEGYVGIDWREWSVVWRDFPEASANGSDATVKGIQHKAKTWIVGEANAITIQSMRYDRASRLEVGMSGLMTGL